MELDVRIDHEAFTPGQPLRLRALLEISGPLPDEHSLRPLNLALVLDRSGSMAGPKLEQLREAVTHLIRRLRPEHRISVVGYSDQVLVLSDGARGEDGHRGAAAAVEQLTPGGMTNLSGGWLRGRELADRHRFPDSLNRVLLMTDGLANVGITEPEALIGLVRTAAGQGISTTTLGFGADFHEDLLQLMADAAGGSSYYVEDPDQAPGIFEEEIDGLLGVAAQNVTVFIRSGHDARFTTVHHSYPVTPIDQGVRLEVGDLYAKEPRQALMEFRVPYPATDRELDVGTLEVEGDVVVPGQGVERRTVALPIRFTPGTEPRVDAAVRRVHLLLESARAREEALKRGEDGDVMGARNVLREVARHLETQLPEDAPARAEAADLMRVSERLEGQGVFHASDIKYVKQQARDQRRSRISAREAYRRGGG